MTVSPLFNGVKKEELLNGPDIKIPDLFPEQLNFLSQLLTFLLTKGFDSLNLSTNDHCMLFECGVIRGLLVL